MKKLFFMILLVIISYCFMSANAMELQYDGESHTYSGPKVNLVLEGESFIPSEGQMPPIILQDRTLVPVREVFEKLGGVVNWDATERKVSVSIEDKLIELWLDNTVAKVNEIESELDVPAKLINGKTMVPVRFISENGGLDVRWDGNTTTVSINHKSEQIDIVNIKATTISKINGIDCIVIDLDGKTQYQSFELQQEDDRPFRIIVDVNNSKFDFNHETIHLNDNDLISQIRFGIQENNVNRIVIDMKNNSDYTVFESKNGMQIIVIFKANFVLDNNSDDSTNTLGIGEESKPVDSDLNNGIESSIIDNNEQNLNDNPIIPDDDNNQVEPDDNNSVVESHSDDNTNNDTNNDNGIPKIDEENENTNKEAEITSTITSMKYSTASEKVRIIIDKKFEYELTELEDPKRVVLEFKHSNLKLEGPSEINLKNKAITSIKATSADDGSAVITVFLANNATYEMSKKTYELQVKAEQPEYRNIEYSNKGNYAELLLKNVELSTLTKLQSKTTNKYTIKYSSSNFDSGSGTIEIDDEFLKKISITNTKITITDKGNMKYAASQEGNDVLFTITKSANDESKIIILDAGHGGSDPGASNGDYQEKTYNLKILLKLKKLLEDAGYTVYTTRESDVTLTVNDRVYLATKDYPEASLYVSIHHNALDNKNYSGTLIMYCARDTSSYGITNKEFASYVLNELVDNLGTVNRGFIEVKENDTSKRVLTEVKMPSILCEIAFISNDDELARIRTDRFQNQAAESIFNGIVKALNKMN